MKLSKEKRDKLIMIGLGTAVALAALWFLLLSPQLNSLEALAGKKTAGQKKLDDTMTDIHNSGKLEAEVDAASNELTVAERDMISGDPYSWMVKMILQFKSPYSNVDMPNLSTIVVGNSTLLPNFPYHQATITVSGTTYYHDLGKFIADFENRYPQMRVQNLVLEPSPSGDEKLAFKMDIIALIK